MPKSPGKPAGRAVSLTTTSVISFSLTLLGAGIAVLAGVVPLRSFSLSERIDVGALLLLMPVVALLLAVVFEVTRIALRGTELPDPSRRTALSWSPGRREG